VLLSGAEVPGRCKDAELDLGKAGIDWCGPADREGRERRVPHPYQARGLESFVSSSTPRCRRATCSCTWESLRGENFDYPRGVLSANSATRTATAWRYDWHFHRWKVGRQPRSHPAVGEDVHSIVATMARRAWVPFLAFARSCSCSRRAMSGRFFFYESWLLAAAFGFTFVLLAYLAPS